MSASNSPIVVSDEEEKQRLDLYLNPFLPDLSRSRIQQLIQEGAIRVDGGVVKPSYRVRAGDRVTVAIPEPSRLPLQVEAEAIPLSVAYEDGHLLVVDKPAGMVVHPAPGAWTGTLVHALLAHCDDLSGINGVLRPGIVHRLDRNTSGLLVVAKSDAAHRHLAAQLEARTISRKYTTLAWGRVVGSGTIDAPIGRSARDRKKMGVRPDGRRAVTRYAVGEEFAFLTQLDLQLETGRTHQIRVHLQHLGHPVFGDPDYSGRSFVRGVAQQHRRRAAELLNLIPRQALHARRLGFAHPITGERIELESPLPEDLADLFEAARRPF
jgi:23S rRNA pseudouridine1911/1915/1917 synthase